MPLRVPKVVRPKVIHEQYAVKLDVQRGGARAQKLARTWPYRRFRLTNAQIRVFFGLSQSVAMLNFDDTPPAPALDTAAPSAPTTPPPQTPPPCAPSPPRPAIKRWATPVRQVPSYSHCFM